MSTPIGNLEDITLRALRILGEVDIIAAEDTRRTSVLLKQYDIQNRVDSYHDHNKEGKTPKLIDALIRGRSVAIVSDAGTPGVSDPAFYLVRSAWESNIPVVPVPGPTAAISAVIVSGLPTDRFVFEGFLPAKKGRTKRLVELSKEIRTLVLYESPHRLLRTLSDLRDVLGDRVAAVCRELTKKYEETLRGRLSEMINIFSLRDIRGEFVIVIQGRKDYEKKSVRQTDPRVAE